MLSYPSHTLKRLLRTLSPRAALLTYTLLPGVCSECFSGQHRYCAEKQIMGFKDSYGGFSEYALADPVSTVKLPDGLGFDS